MIVDYELLGRASTFYKNRGYTQIEVPRFVDVQTSSLTCDNLERVFLLKSDQPRALIGSSEQGFLQIFDDLEPNRLYFSVSECFRNEPVEDRTHQTVFSKLELFVRGADLVERFVVDALDFYRGENLVSKVAQPVLATTGQRSFDICLDGVEIGSYGAFEKGGKFWSCGTGLALPRFSTAEVMAAGPRWSGDDDEIWESLKAAQESRWAGWMDDQAS